MSDAPPGTLTFPPDRQRTWGRWVRRLFVLFGVLAVLFLTASFALSRYLEPERLARWVEPRIEAAVNRQVEVDRSSVSFLPLGIRLEGLEVADPTGLAPALAEVESLEFRVRLLPLIRRQVQVREIVVEGLAADLQVDADGRSNYGDFSPSEDAPELDSTGDPPFALELDGIRLLSGRVAYRSQADGTVLRVEELAGESSVRQEVGGPWQVDGRFTGRVSAGDGPMGTSSPDGEAGGWIHDLPVTLELALDVADDGESLHVREGTVGVEELGLAVTGEVHGLKEPVREVELALLARQVPLGRALSLVPDSVMDPAEVEADGTLSADLAIRGRMGPGETPDVTGITALAGGTVRYRGRTLTEGLEMEVELPGDGSLRPRGTGQLLGGGFRIDGTVMTDEPRAVDLRIEAAPDLSRIDPDFLPPGVELAGLTPMELTRAGERSDPGGLGAWGELGLRQLR
ncbi:MAG: AsmA family protein, partial [Gemmatimonadota bacterium]